MPTRSSLELMLDKLQQPEEKPIATPPALPLRPVSRARPRRDFERRSLHANGGSPCFVRKRTKKDEFGHLKESENWKERAEKGICQIQKWYRGHQVVQCYKELRKGAIALQSFIRGEVARRGYEHNSRAIIIIQRQTRKFLDHRTRLVHLQKQVLKTEAKLRGKAEENILLKKKLSEIEMKWEQYEERMKSMEKEWQEQLTYIQEWLVAANKTNGRILEIPINSNYDCNRVEEQVCRPNEELRKLKLRFKAWKKVYKSKLRDAQLALRKSGTGSTETPKSHKNWWGRLSRI